MKEIKPKYKNGQIVYFITKKSVNIKCEHCNQTHEKKQYSIEKGKIITTFTTYECGLFYVTSSNLDGAPFVREEKLLCHLQANLYRNEAEANKRCTELNERKKRIKKI